MAAATSQQEGPTAVPPANGVNEEGDPFTSGASATRETPHRFSSFDTQLFALNHPTSSPAQAKRALEAHLSETDRRLQETSKLGKSLVQQRANLAQRIRDVDSQGEGSKIGPELRQKLVDIEKEYNEVGRQSAKAFLGPKFDTSGTTEGPSTPFALDGRNPTSPTKFSSQAVDSPSKVNVPRKQRNQAADNKDIEFAAEITTSLLGQVRQLQAVLAEREDALKILGAEKSKLETDAEGFSQRLKHMGEMDQRYKDANWALETQLQDLQASGREAATREQKLQQALQASTSEKHGAQQELDDFRQKHGRISEDFILMKKSHESELAEMRKNFNLGESEKGSLQRKVNELTSQNQELARGLQSRLRAEELGPQLDPDLPMDEDTLPLPEQEPSPPPSPTKGGQRNSALESETLKSSLNHAHKMIQTLKGTINREKSEKLELKRMLQEARDEVEVRRGEPSEKRLKSRPQQDTKKFPWTGLGASRQSKTDVMVDDPENDPEWEAAGDEGSRNLDPGIKRSSSIRAASRLDSSDAYQTANETEDGFETANERDTTDNEAFQTGAESIGEDSSDDLTETEGVGRGGTVRGRRPSPLITNKPGERKSFQSTASTSEDEDEQNVQTPVHGQAQRFKVRMNRGSRRSRADNGEGDSPATRDSPASFTELGGEGGQSLAAELENLSGEDEGTPSKTIHGTPTSTRSSRRTITDQRSSASLRKNAASQPSTPGLRTTSAIYTGAPPVPRVPMVDAGTMTEPSEPVQESSRDSMPEGPTQGSPGSRLSGIWPATAAASLTNRIFGSSPATPQNKALQSEPTSGSAVDSNSTADSPPGWDKPSRFSGTSSVIHASADSTPLSTRSATSQAQDSETSNTNRTLTADMVGKGDTEDLTVTQPPIQEEPLSLSPLVSLETQPVQPPAATDSQVSQSGSKKSLSNQEGEASTGILGSVFGWRKSTATPPVPQIAEDETSKDIEINETPEMKETKTPLQEASASTTNKLPQVAKAIDLAKRPTVPKADQSSQTTLSSEQIDSLLLARRARVPSIEKLAAAGITKPADMGIASTATPAHQGKVPEVRVPEGSNRDSLTKAGKRPTSTASTRSRMAQYPPLPADHQEAIAAAASSQRDSSSSIMGPPVAPASAYSSRSLRSRNNSRPQTPSQQGYASPSSKGGTTPRAGRFSSARSMASRRSSVSSFASELDERFNIRAEGMLLPQGFNGNTDPRMIQAITQTMIGEMMWKYTRKAGRGEMSNTRHARFFWVHPYTRTLYWSERDPVTANRAELKSKSVAIEAVRVVTDDNPMPPGLHRKSIIVVTPGRSVKFTAQTSHRHETWFNALSYLLLRSGPDGADNEDITDADVQEFNPMGGYDRRSARSRVSVASFRSQATANRNAQSSLQARAPVNSLANRPVEHPQTVPENAPENAPEDGEEERGLSVRKRISRSLSRQRSRPSSKAPEQREPLVDTNPAPVEPKRDSSRRSSVSKPLHSSISSRISSYWKPAESNSGNRSSVRSRASMNADNVGEPGVLEGGRSVVSVNATNDSAEDLRRVIEEREGKGNLENVRACCDGQHDVAALRGANGAGSHNHAHTQSYGPRTSSLAKPA